MVLCRHVCRCISPCTNSRDITRQEQHQLPVSLFGPGSRVGRIGGFPNIFGLKASELRGIDTTNASI